MSVVIVVVVVNMKITKSQDLGICACCKHNKSVDICEKLVSVHFELLNMAHKRYKSCISGSACLWFTNCIHSAPCALGWLVLAHLLKHSGY